VQASAGGGPCAALDCRAASPAVEAARVYDDAVGSYTTC
jgi:hypothetical protein